jgi:anti-sigma factor RsiW
MSSIAMQPVAPDEIMAYLDGELSSTEARVMSEHVAACAECADAAEQFRSISQRLSGWQVPIAPPTFDDAVRGRAAKAVDRFRGRKRGLSPRLTSLSRGGWALAGAGIACVAILVSFFGLRAQNAPQPAMMSMSAAPQDRQDAYFYNYSPALESKVGKDERLQRASKGRVAGIIGGAAGVVNSLAGEKSDSAPMIVRTVKLDILVTGLPAARSSLDSILARYQGYSAQLTVSTPENAPPFLESSLRIPVSSLSSAIAELKALGHVQMETQSGEEITQQHTDLAQRLKTARETEERFRAILQGHPGAVDDVLKVEEEIARVRGEIESMEAEQRGMEHHVAFATVELVLNESYKEPLNSRSGFLSIRIRNAFVAGYRNAMDAAVGIILFFVEYGMAILIWIAVIGLPVYFVLRRYRRIRSKV